MVLVFGLGFVLLGVGSGNSGLGDLFNGNLFGGGSSGPSIKKAEDRVAKSPNSVVAYLALGEALVAHRRTDEAIGAYEKAVRLAPRNLGALNQLVALYEEKASSQTEEAQTAAIEAQTAQPATFGFGPLPSSKLGKAFAAYPDPIAESLTSGATLRYSEALGSLQSTRRKELSAYTKIAALQPDEPSVQFQVAYVADLAADVPTALAAYRLFLKRFPDDSQAAVARQRIKQLTTQTASAGSG